jgi:hypothetical protein
MEPIAKLYGTPPAYQFVHRGRKQIAPHMPGSSLSTRKSQHDKLRQSRFLTSVAADLHLRLSGAVSAGAQIIPTDECLVLLRPAVVPANNVERARAEIWIAILEIDLNC